MQSSAVARPARRHELADWRRTTRQLGLVLKASWALPFSGAMIFALVATAWGMALNGVDADAFMDWASTDVHNLLTRPIVTLVTSAVIVPGGDLLTTALLVALAAIPLERRIGSLRTLAVFASGHVLATLVTEGVVAVRIAGGALPSSAAFRVDVGSSYGMWALFGALFFFTGVHRRWVVAAAFLYLGISAASSTDAMTSAGHLLSLGVGLAWWPVLASRPALSGGPAPAGRPALGRRTPPFLAATHQDAFVAAKTGS